MAEAFTVNEVVALFGLDERRVRKDVEHGVFGSMGSPPRFALSAVVYLRALADIGFELRVEDRKKLHGLIRKALAMRKPPASIELSPITELKLAPIVDEVARRLARFDAWRSTITIDPEILGGEPAFPKTRLAVRRVGGLLLRGASPEAIRDEYPRLTEDDLEFAKLYTQAHPRVGRPRERHTPAR